MRSCVPGAFVRHLAMLMLTPYAFLSRNRVFRRFWMRFVRGDMGEVGFEPTTKGLRGAANGNSSRFGFRTPESAHFEGIVPVACAQLVAAVEE